MFKEVSVTAERIARASMAIALCMGASACTDWRKHHAVTHAIPTPSPIPVETKESTPMCVTSLDFFTVNLVTQVGSAYATNEGECVNVYSHELADTLGPIGQIQTKGKFYIDCFDMAMPAFRVTMKGSQGAVDLGYYALAQMDEDPSARKIRTC